MCVTPVDPVGKNGVGVGCWRLVAEPQLRLRSPPAELRGPPLDKRAHAFGGILAVGQLFLHRDEVRHCGGLALLDGLEHIQARGHHGRGAWAAMRWAIAKAS